MHKSASTSWKFALLAGTLMMALGSIARADYIPASWDETIDFGDTGLEVPPTRTYTHDLTTDGFDPLYDIILGYELVIDLENDGDDEWWEGQKAKVNLPGGIGDRIFWELGGQEYGGWSALGWAQIEFTGMLTVSIESLRIGFGHCCSYVGDFYLMSSTLTGYGKEKIRVPEPGTLALLGLGLLGIGVAKRRRALTG